MNELKNIPLDEILLKSFKALQAGDNELAEKLFQSFESSKDKAIDLAEKAVKNGDIKTVDVIINSFEKAREVSVRSISRDDKNIADYRTLNETEEVNEIAKNVLSEFEKHNEQTFLKEKYSKTLNNSKNSSKIKQSLAKNNNSIDNQLKQYLKEGKFDIAEKEHGNF